jgi:hypothetical protein
MKGKVHLPGVYLKTKSPPINPSINHLKIPPKGKKKSFVPVLERCKCNVETEGLSRETYPSKGVSVEVIGEEVGDVLLQESDHGVLLPPYRTHPRADAFERVLTASVVQERRDWVSPIQEHKPFF